jgi:hypothetical protein
MLLFLYYIKIITASLHFGPDSFVFLILSSYTLPRTSSCLVEQKLIQYQSNTTDSNHNPNDFHLDYKAVVVIS